LAQALISCPSLPDPILFNARMLSARMPEATPAPPIAHVSREDDIAVAVHLAQTRGLPPELRYETVEPFLAHYGYAVTNERNWAKVSQEQPELHIDVMGHTEFGGHTQYEIKCEVRRRGAECEAIRWGTIRRLVHMREGLHDLVKRDLQGRYDAYFGKTPFAHHAGVPGTTSRLHAWCCSLSACINSGMVNPCVVANVIHVLDGPGTQIHPEADSLPITSSIFGGGGLTMDADLQRLVERRMREGEEDADRGGASAALAPRPSRSPLNKHASSIGATSPPRTPLQAWS